MAVTKTNFINYVRCPRYVALEQIKAEKWMRKMTIQEYLEEQDQEQIKEILSNMFDGNDEDLIDVKNEYLEVMLPYYNEAELLAGKLAPLYFDGSFIYSKDTKQQESFDAVIEGIRYLCYVDIYNEGTDKTRIIEVKATTTNKYLSLGKSQKNEFGEKEIISIFQPDANGIYRLLEDLDLSIESYMKVEEYEKARAKLFDKWGPAGHYVYDLAVQRYIIEADLKQNDPDKIPQMEYYLAVLNAAYVFDGTYIGSVPDYHTDSAGNEIVCFFDMTTITRDLLDKIELDRRRVAQYIKEANAAPYPLGIYCEKKKTTKCKFCKLCWNILPEKNSIMAYIDGHHGFVDEVGNKYDRYDLINDGKVTILDLPETMLNRPKNRIQRQVVESHIPYMNLDKINRGMQAIHFPIYHLDFETFPCPIPRYKGEKCYTQSVFQFSLHIERELGKCDKQLDHFEYLAPNHQDNRETLIQKMCEWIDTESGGTILVYNESFEKTRLKELGLLFPEYQKRLFKMRDMIFDLMYLTKTNSSFYESFGYDKEEAKMFNYYHSDMTGSFSIKKILPLFSTLTYKGMEIGNGVEALVAYASFPKMTPKEYTHKYQKLVEYCKQDTWAMVEILWGLRKKCQEMSKEPKTIASV